MHLVGFRQPPIQREKCQCHIDTVSSPDDGHIVARNMQRSWNKFTKSSVHLVGFIWKSLYRDAWSTKHKIHAFVPPNDQSMMLNTGAEVLRLQERNTLYACALLFDQITYALIWLSETKWNHRAHNYAYRADIHDTKVSRKIEFRRVLLPWVCLDWQLSMLFFSGFSRNLRDENRRFLSSCYHFNILISCLFDTL